MTSQPTAKQIAAEIAETMEHLAVWFPAAHAEITRVHNVGLPLADGIGNGWIRTLTPEGRDHLVATLTDVKAMAAVLADMPYLGVMRPVRNHHDDLVLSFAELWDAITERTRDAA